MLDVAAAQEGVVVGVAAAYVGGVVGMVAAQEGVPAALAKW